MPNVNDPNQGYRPSVAFHYNGSNLTAISIVLAPNLEAIQLQGGQIEPFLEKWRELRTDEQPEFLRFYAELLAKPRPVQATSEEALLKLQAQVQELKAMVVALRREHERKPVVMQLTLDGPVTQEAVWKAFQEMQRRSGLSGNSG